MLLEFKFENYKSFYNENTFLMIPAPKIKDLSYSLLTKQINNKEYKALSSAVFYGANAAGKTNIIGALQTFKHIVLLGNINNTNIQTLNYSESNLELIPNNSYPKKDTLFLLKFIHNDYLFEYSIKMDLGKFLANEYNRKITLERLLINDKEIFIRTNNTVLINEKNIKKISELLLPDFSKNKKTIFDLINNSLIDTELFLINGFKNLISSKISLMIIDFFTNKLLTYYHSEQLEMFPSFKEEYYEDKLITNIIKDFGIISNSLVYKKKEETKDTPILYSLINKTFIPSKVYESFGTIRFINILPLILKTLKTGSTLIIDEFDSSIHPMAIMNIINIFHNNEVNINNAQLIFNTHNPLYLNNNLLRRDEMKFIERDDETGISKHYSLSDFGTKGTRTRNTSDYMNNYFVSEYGAIRDIDFTESFKEILGLI